MSKYIDADVLMEYLQGIKQQAEADNKTKFDALESTIDVINSTIMMKTDEIMRIVENMPTVDVEPVREWIPCSERFPEDGKCVLICYESGAEDIAWRNHEDWWVGFSMNSKRKGAVAWMPLPEPPKMDGGNEDDHGGA